MARSLQVNDAGIGLRTLGVRTRLLSEEGSLTQGHDHCGCACERSPELSFGVSRLQELLTAFHEVNYLQFPEASLDFEDHDCELQHDVEEHWEDEDELWGSRAFSKYLVQLALSHTR